MSQDKGHKDAWRAFLKAVQQGQEPPIPYDQLIGVTRASFAAVDSLRNGKTVKI
jgi:polar amino acid transport system substrate-binding protein